MVHPDSPPAPFFTRAYGCIQPNYVFDQSLRLAPGERLTQRFRVVAHDGGATAFDIDAAFDEFACTPFELSATG